MTFPSKLSALRPWYQSSPTPLHWVHLTYDNSTPLCGVEYDENKYTLSLEQVLVDPADMGPNVVEICKACACIHYQFDVKTVQAGQTHAYADSHYIYNVTDLGDPPRNRIDVLTFCLRFIRFGYRHNAMPHPFAPRIVRFYEIEPRLWHYHVTMLYTG